MRATITGDPFIAFDEGKDWITRGTWPCKWICCRGTGEAPFVTAYRRRFTLDTDATVRVHVSADERYELFLDGRRIGRGSERGDRNNWYYETYDVPISKGDHVFVARVWSFGTRAPFAQMTVYPGFIFAPEGEFMDKLGTGIAEWEAKKLGGYEFTDPMPAWGTGAKLIVSGDSFPWGFENGDGVGWEPVDVRDPGANGFIRNEYGYVHLMKPATLPEMIEREVFVGSVRFVSDKPDVRVNSADDFASEHDLWNLIKSKGKITLPANTTRRIIIDLEGYYCAYPEIVTSGGKGSSIRVNWAEALYEKTEGFGIKGNRNEIEGRTFLGVGDTFKPDGGKNRRFDTLWWMAGRYIEIVVGTTNEPLTIESFRLRETRYPLEMESEFQSSDTRLADVIPIGLRGLQMCSHETYLDCPYYEQLMYSGDTRLECLSTYAITHDDRLPRKALHMFDQSRHVSGVNESRYPSRVTQIIPPFSLWWVGMVHDYSLWRDDPAYVQQLMPGVRAIIDFYLSHLNNDDLIEAPNGWNFIDWVPAWTWGLPPDADKGVSGLLNWQFVFMLSQATSLAESILEPYDRMKWRRAASLISYAATNLFWDEKRGLLADDLAHTSFSEHTQCMALLSGLLDEFGEKRERIVNRLLNDPDLHRTTISFTHYLFETYRMLGRMDKLFERLGLWFDFEKLGLKTTLEQPEPSRSDCHGWGAHPIYHYFASILGIRPASPGFATVRIEPQLGPLTHAMGKLVHPQGFITADLHMQGNELRGSIELPEGITGTFQHGRYTIELAPGRQEI